MTLQTSLERVLQAPLPQTAALATVVCLLHLLYRRRKRASISCIPGPEKSDPLFGNLTDLYFEEAGESYFKWQEKYGQVFKIHGLLGKEYLMISDPKAMQHVYTNSQSFTRQKHTRNLLKMLFGPAIGVVDFHDHRRQRKVIGPAFGTPQIRNLFPVFIRHSQKLVQLLRQEISGDSDHQSLQIDIYDYTTRVTLDLTGEAAFEYQFGALDNKQDKLKEVMRNLETQSLGNTSKSQIFVSFIAEYLPEIITDVMSYLPTKKFRYIKQTRDTITAIAAEVMTEKQNDMRNGLDGGNDLMSLLLRANAGEDKQRRMSDEEITAGITTITFAGYTTTASTLAFALWELAKSPVTQRRVRDEILAAKRVVLKNTGIDEIPFSYYEKMPLLIAFTKETLRVHPVGFMGARRALEDEVIPLSQPLKLLDGRSITEIPVSKGQNIWINIPGYNRLPSIFGENPHEFNIDRWLDGRLDALPGLIGVYGNLITFGHGPHVCVGWRFSIHEMHTILIELLANFEFRLPKDYRGVRRTGAATMIPTIPGDRGAGTRLDLEISILPDSNPRE